MDGFDVPGYRLTQKLSETNMSVVFLAEDLEFDNRPVAIKILKPDLANDPEYTARFRRELAVAAKLNHPNIVGVYARGSTLQHLVMPFIDGTTLAAELAERVRLDLTRTVRIIRQVAAALDHAHARGWAHRDVKPGNVMLHAGSDHAYLIDFGIAAELDVERRTEVGRTVGTEGYLAPELRSDVLEPERAPVTRQADIYSLGVVVYRCLTGRLPYDDQPTEAARWLARHGKPPLPIRAQRPDLPAETDGVVNRTLATAADRYATCTELADALDALLTGPAIPVHQELTLPPVDPAREPDTSPTPPLRRQSRLAANRNPLLVGALALVLIAAGIVAWVSANDDPSGPDLSRVPPSLIGSCAEADTDSGLPGATSVLRCGDGTQEIRFSLFADRARVDLAYAAALQDANIPRGTGDCTRATGAEHRYPNGGTQTGRVVCWAGGGTSTLVWTDDERRTVARAEAAESGDADLTASWAGWVGIPPFPTDDEQSLIDLVEKPRCQRAEAGTLDSFRNLTAAVECDANSRLATSVTYYRFGDQEGLRRTYDGHVATNNPPSGVLCADNPPGFIGNRRWDLRSVDMGEMLCYPGERGAPMLEWTVEPLQVMARVTGSEPADVAEWWRRGLGISSGKIVAAANKRADPAFPDERERALLEHIPRASQVNCMRPSADQVRENAGDTEVTAVTCGPTNGAGAVYYYQFPDLASMNARYFDALGTSGPDCTTAPKDFTGDAPYTLGAASGRLGCAKPAGQLFLTWTSNSLRIATFAYQGYDTDYLLDWWRTEAGPT
ncbi:MAG: protein kinase [Actinophytocola sp.]|uniref:serine/threonine-protein kinase n=1 Tax=Actinophytocola sp. TaxID=1872138 RepID=UPI00132245DA|nr:serine/threonine-protein kinase [Actinophytocola sp.]MPZ79330.1 protein kinase [Actinophytocola sp.]